MSPIRFHPGTDEARRGVGRVGIESLSDGMLHVGPEVVLDPGPDVMRLAQDPTAGEMSIPVNVFLLRHPDGLVLVDAGAGSFGGPTAGLLPGELASRGISPGDIRFVLMTHLHPDHVGGLVGPDDEAVFDRARIVVDPKELSFWTDADLGAPISDRLRRNMLNVRRALKPYANRLMAPNDLALSGINPVELPGHTPGHTGWLIEEGSERILLWGDIVHFVALQTVYPDVALAYDVDAAAAALTRQRVFALVADQGMEIGGAHLPFPGFGKLTRDESERAAG